MQGLQGTDKVFRTNLVPAKEKWLGQPAFRHYGTFAELRKLLPEFEVKPFTLEATNEYFDVIVRKPLRDEKDAKTLPVGTVSKKYALIQHFTVMDSVAEALLALEISAGELSAELRLSDYQERMHLRFVLPRFDFNPGDGQPMLLVLNCLNSVDKSLALEISIGWYRRICSNGMMGLVERSRLRRVHISSIDPADILEYLREEFDLVPNERELYADWLGADISSETITDWADGPLAKAWGPHAAARTLNILRSGHDGRIIDRLEKQRPSERFVEKGQKVPGTFPPVTNPFHISQSLSWIAGHRTSVQDQIEWLKSIPGLMQSLLKQAE